MTQAIELSTKSKAGSAHIDVIDRIKQVAVRTFKGALSVAPDHNGKFRSMVEFKDGESVKPLLLVGTVHGEIEDGHCIAVLNPDKSLLDQINPGVGYGRHIFKEIVARKCDAAMNIWIDDYKPDGVYVTAKYEAREFQPPKFTVR